MDDHLAPRVFPFAFTFGPVGAALDRVLGISPASAWVEVDDTRFVVRFGRWHLSTARSNVAEARVTGPYRTWKVIGPPRLSLADRGITFGTGAAAGVCVRFHEPVPGLLPVGRVRHPAATITVADPGALVAALVG